MDAVMIAYYTKQAELRPVFDMVKSNKHDELRSWLGSRDQDARSLLTERPMTMPGDRPSPSQKYSLLDTAAVYGSTESIAAMIEYGADPNGASYGATPLSLACGMSRVESVAVLLRCGASALHPTPSQPDAFGPAFCQLRVCRSNKASEASWQCYKLLQQHLKKYPDEAVSALEMCVSNGQPDHAAEVAYACPRAVALLCSDHARLGRVLSLNASSLATFVDEADQWEERMLNARDRRLHPLIYRGVLQLKAALQLCGGCSLDFRVRLLDGGAMAALQASSGSKQQAAAAAAAADEGELDDEEEQDEVEEGLGTSVATAEQVATDALAKWQASRRENDLLQMRLRAVLEHRTAYDASRDAAMVFQAASEGRPLELAKRLRLGVLAGGLEVEGQVEDGAGGTRVVGPLEAARLGGHAECVQVLEEAAKDLSTQPDRGSRLRLVREREERLAKPVARARKTRRGGSLFEQEAVAQEAAVQSNGTTTTPSSDPDRV